MRAYSSTQAFCNPLSPAISSQFAALSRAASGSFGSPSPDGDQSPKTARFRLKPPPLPACKYHLYPKALKRELRWYRHLRNTTSAAA